MIGGQVLLRVTCAIALLAAGAGTAAAADNNAQWGIFAMKLDGTEVRLLAQVEGCTRHARPRWSHDGEQVVFDAQLKGGGLEAYVVRADGTGLRKVGDFGYAVWTPDDKQLVFRERGVSHIQNLDGSGRSMIATGSSPALSPDGSQLAVSFQDNITVTNLVTGESHTLFARKKEIVDYGFTWFPDGKRLAVVARPEPRTLRELLFVSAEGEEHGVEVRLRGEVGGFVSFSPDGKQLALDYFFKLQLLDTAGKSPGVEIVGQKGANRDPDISPDGRWIVFASSRDPK